MPPHVRTPCLAKVWLRDEGNFPTSCHMQRSRKMAEKKQSESLAEGVNKELTCAICLSRYNQPKILPCLHLYCKGCLEIMSKKSREERNITCPQCKEIHEIPPQGIDGFTTFFTINNLLELLHIYEISDLETPKVSIIKCSSGLSESCDPAGARCLTCSDYLCESCCTIHRKLKATKDHVVKTFEEIKQSDKKTGVQSLHKKHHCNKHKDKLLELYCKTCKKAICFLCALLTHKQHDCAVISEVRAEAQKVLEKQILKVHAKEIEFQNHQKYTENLLKISNEAAKSAEAKVNQVCSALIQSIEARCAQLINDIHHIHESEVKQITLESDSITHSLSRFSGGIQFTKQLLDNGDDVEVMVNSDQTAQTLTSLTQLTWDTTMFKPSLLRPEFESMEECVSTFGKVLCTVQPDDIIFQNLPMEASVGKEHSFEVSLSKGISERGYDASAEITITHSNCSILAPFVIKRKEFNSWSVSFTPAKSGEHKVSVKLRGCSFSILRTIDVTDTVEQDNFQDKLRDNVWIQPSPKHNMSDADSNLESRSISADSSSRSVQSAEHVSVEDFNSESRSVSADSSPRSVSADITEYTYSRSNSEESLPRSVSPEPLVFHGLGERSDSDESLFCI